MTVNKIAQERKRTGKKGDDPLQYLLGEGDGMTRIISVRRPPSRSPPLDTMKTPKLTNLSVRNRSPLRRPSKQRHNRPLGPPLPLPIPTLVVPLPQRNRHRLRQALPIPFPPIHPYTALPSPHRSLGILVSRPRSMLERVYKITIDRNWLPPQRLRAPLPTGVGQEMIPNGALVAYHFNDVHRDESVYPDAEK